MIKEKLVTEGPVLKQYHLGGQLILKRVKYGTVKVFCLFYIFLCTYSSSSVYVAQKLLSYLEVHYRTSSFTAEEHKDKLK